jgi:2-dehydropantoate 2-reductase
MSLAPIQQPFGAENHHERSDLMLLACKALAVGPDTAILPLLNGMRHLDILDRRFGAGHVLGGQCLFSVTLNERGEIVHLNETHNLSFGKRDTFKVD